MYALIAIVFLSTFLLSRALFRSAVFQLTLKKLYLQFIRFLSFQLQLLYSKLGIKLISFRNFCPSSQASLVTNEIVS